MTRPPRRPPAQARGEGKEPTHKGPGQKPPATKEPLPEQPGRTRPAPSQPARNEPARNEPARKEPARKETTRKETTRKETTRKETTRKPPAPKQAAPKRAVRIQAAGQQAESTPTRREVDRGRGPARPARTRPSTEQFRRRRLAAALAALVLLVGLGLTARVLLYDAGLADVEDVRVTGLTTVLQADVLAAAAVVPGGPLADVDTGGIATRVAQLPAVASVQVGRGWPHTVVVEVTERVAVATAAVPGGVALVDRTGAVYPGTPPAGLPRLTFGAVGPDDPSTRAALASLVALPDPVRAQVLTVDVTVAGVGVPGQVAFGLIDDRQVRWGTPDRTAEKAAVLTPLLTQEGQVYDVTSPDLPTIRR